MGSRIAVEQARNAPPGRQAWSRSAGPFVPVRLGFLRLRQTWRLLGAAGLGMLIAVALVCLVPLYTTLVLDVQIQRVLSSQPPTDTNIEVDLDVPNSSVSADNISSLTHLMQSLGSNYLSSFTSASTVYYNIYDKVITPAKLNGAGLRAEGPGGSFRTDHGVISGNSQLLLYAFNYQQALPHMKLLAGRLPQDTAAGKMPEVMATPALDLKPGETVTLNQPKITVKIVGVWFPKDQSDPFWNGQVFDTFVAANPFGPPNPPPTYPLLFTQHTFINTFQPPQQTRATSAPPTPGPNIGLHVVYYTNIHSITASNASYVATQVKNFHSDVDGTFTGLNEIQNVLTGTRLDSLLDGLSQQFTLLAQPLYIVVAQVVGLALLFITAMAGLLIDSQSAEIATLKSRGASGTQLLGSYTLQGLGLALLAALAGPFLAVAGAVALVRLSIPGANAAGGGSLNGYLTPQMAIQPALIGAVLSATALVFAAWQAARLDVLAFRREQARSGRRPFWQRYYLDLLLVLICIAGYIEFGQFGGLNLRTQLGQSSDPLLLLAPALLLLAGALLALRLFPLVAALGARIAARARGAVGLLALAQVARTTASFSRLTLLLTLAVGMGIFSLSFQSSLARNTADRAAYMTGGDERVVIQGSDSGVQLTAPFQAQFARMAGVQGVTPILRTSANTSPSEGGLLLNVLGVDPASFAQVAHWRNDFASQPITSLMAQMQAHEYPGDAKIAAAAAASNTTTGDNNHPVWVLVDQTLASALNLHPGYRFSTNPAGSTASTIYFVVGAVIQDCPTMYDSLPGGYMVADLNDYLAALASSNVDAPANGPTEFWLRTNGRASDAARRHQQLRDPNFFVDTITDLPTLTAQLQADPVTAGMSGLLLAGALIAVLLAILGSVIQSAVSTRQRLTQFAILRTLGGVGRQLLGVLLTQQAMVYLFGLLGGTLLGLALSTATLPFLQFSSTLIDPTTLGTPPETLVFNLPGMALFYAALLGAFVLALALAARAAMRIGLGKALRIGED